MLDALTFQRGSEWCTNGIDYVRDGASSYWESGGGSLEFTLLCDLNLRVEGVGLFTHQLPAALQKATPGEVNSQRGLCVATESSSSRQSHMLEGRDCVDVLGSGEHCRNVGVWDAKIIWSRWPGPVRLIPQKCGMRKLVEAWSLRSAEAPEQGNYSCGWSGHHGLLGGENVRA